MAAGVLRTLSPPVPATMEGGQTRHRLWDSANSRVATTAALGATKAKRKKKRQPPHRLASTQAAASPSQRLARHAAQLAGLVDELEIGQAAVAAARDVSDMDSAMIATVDASGTCSPAKSPDRSARSCLAWTSRPSDASSPGSEPAHRAARSAPPEGSAS